MRQGPRFYGITAAVLAVAVGMLAVFVAGEVSTSVRAPEPVPITIKRGESLNRLTHRLGDEGVLQNPRFFHLYAVLRGDTGRIKAGNYVVEQPMSPRALLDYFIEGDVRLTAVTIPEGFSVAEVAARIQAHGLGDAATFRQLAADPDFIATLELPEAAEVGSLEGFLFPETYYFHEGAGEASLIRTMAREFNKRARPVLKHAPDVGLTPYEALVLASIVEKETGASHERPIIAGVFHNRLTKGWRLDSDPTVIYGIDDFDGNLTRAHLRTPTDYNTYQMRGLPPTPIANPGMGSIRAAVDPADVEYFFFVSKGDGTHHFSKDLRSHNKAVYKYQKAPNRNRSS